MLGNFETRPDAVLVTNDEGHVTHEIIPEIAQAVEEIRLAVNEYVENEESDDIREILLDQISEKLTALGVHMTREALEGRMEEVEAADDRVALFNRARTGFGGTQVRATDSKLCGETIFHTLHDADMGNEDSNPATGADRDTNFYFDTDALSRAMRTLQEEHQQTM